MYRHWSPAALRKLRRLYPNRSAAEISRVLKRSRSAIDNKATKLGLKKSAGFLAAFRFHPGMTPWNSGVTGYMGANRTSFGKGHMPHNHRPIGSERISKDGYRERKVSEPKRWRAVHVLLWEAVHGKVRRGRIVVFKPGSSKLEPSIGNLECITRVENMRRNTYHRYPKEIARLIQLCGALNRQINKRASREEQNRGSKGPPIRDAGKGEGRRHAARPGEDGRGDRASHHQQRQGGKRVHQGRGRQQGNRIHPRGRAVSATATAGAR